MTREPGRGAVHLQVPKVNSSKYCSEVLSLSSEAQGQPTAGIPVKIKTVTYFGDTITQNKHSHPQGKDGTKAMSKAISVKV